MSFRYLIRFFKLFNLKKAPVRARIARAWIDEKIQQRSLQNNPSIVMDLAKSQLDFQTWFKHI